jgi:hypothetical protein
MKKNLIIVAVFFALASWQCSKLDQGKNNLNLKESLDQGVANINTAFEKIAGSKGYKLLNVTEAEAKSEYGFNDSIDLSLIAGIYEFKPDTVFRHYDFFPYRLFNKTGTSGKFIVNLPQELVFHPKHLHFFIYSDSVLKNDFRITANDYHFYYTWWNTYDYKLAADFDLNSVSIGSLDMTSSWSSGSESKFMTGFTFPEGYTITRSGQTGDTAKMVFSLAKGSDILLKESTMFTGDGFERKERQYDLTIGNVDIKRSTGVDSIQVYLNGALQKKAGARIIDTADYNASICYKRDILLTFDDGTTAKLSDLISPSLTTLRSLSQALGEMYISKHIIDYIAISVYYFSR